MRPDIALSTATLNPAFERGLVFFGELRNEPTTLFL